MGFPNYKSTITNIIQRNSLRKIIMQGMDDASGLAPFGYFSTLAESIFLFYFKFLVLWLRG